MSVRQLLHGGIIRLKISSVCQALQTETRKYFESLRKMSGFNKSSLVKIPFEVKCL